MPTTFMVKSSLVFLSCHINVVLMTILYLFNISKSTQQHYILSALQLMLYLLGVVFNIYVVLFASRRWELVVKYFENGINYMRMVQHEIKCNLMSSIKDSVHQLSAAVGCILEDCSYSDSDDSGAISPKPLEEIEPLAPNKEESVAKLNSRSIFPEEPVARTQARLSFPEEIAAKLQAISDVKTPELKTVLNFRAADLPKSDPIKKTLRNEVKAESPELLKNKIFKSRMILSCDSPVSRKGK